MGILDVQGCVTEEIDHKLREHSWLSPSGLSAIVDGKCYGKPLMEKDYPEKPAGSHAERGTLIHEYAEKLLKGDVIDPPPAEDLFSIAIGYYNYCQDIIKSIQEKSFGNWNIHAEQKVTVFKEFEITGTGDCFIWDTSGTLHLIDLKTGRIPVSVEENPQLMAYAIGFLEQYSEKIICTNVVFHIYQPGNPQAPWTVPYHTLMEVYRPIMWDACSTAYKLYTGALEINYDTHLHINDSCIYCRAKHSCPRFRTHLAQEALVLLDDYPIQIPRASELTTEQKVRVFKVKSLVLAYLDEVEASLYAETAAGSVSELMIQPGKLVRKWSTDEAYVKATLNSLGVEPIRESLITITEAEKALKKRRLELPDDVFEKVQQKSKLVVKNREHLNLLEDIE